MLSSVPVNLIREWCYCPRKVFYMECMNISPIYPRWVKQGEDFHKEEEKLWKRRNLSRFNLKEGKQYHNLSVKNKDLGLHGIVDMVIETENTVYAIEFKLSANNKRRGDILQLVAYAMLIEKFFLKKSDIGFLVGKGKVLHTIDIDEKKRKEAVFIVRKIQKTIEQGMKPETSATVRQCQVCPYLNFCNDRF